ncbi:MAG: glycosyltransferase, partial [Ilumatobacteraceae bacterium]
MTRDNVPRTVLVIPCYNEADRLRSEAIRSLTESWFVETMLVDDGSTDNTAALLSQLANDFGRVTVHAMHSNRGKA